MEARTKPRDSDLIEPFKRLYYAEVDPEELAARAAADLQGAAAAHLAFGKVFSAGQARIRVYNPVREQHGWASTHTVVEIVNDDMPFLVDSVTMEVNRQGLTLHLVIHPVLRILRDAKQELLSVDTATSELEPLVGRMQVSDVESVRRRPSVSLAAYQCVLSGNALPWDDPEGGAQAKRLFEQAIALDPAYGMPHALLAAMKVSEWRDDLDGDDALLDEGHALARHAVELDSNESTCFSMLALACMFQRHFELTRQYARRAIELNPNNQWNQADMGVMLVYLGEPEEALEWLGRARQIDPFFDPPWYFRAIGQALMNLHRYDEALAMLEQVTPRSLRVAVLQAGCHGRLHDAAGAAEAVATVLALKPGFSIARFMTREPFKNPEDAAHLAQSLELAGLPA